MLITRQYVIDNFPLWEKFFVDEDGNPDTDLLDKEIENAEIEFSEYLNRTAETITNKEKNYLLNILKKKAFDRMHGDTVFENPPLILKTYDETIEKLKQLRSKFSINANNAKFTGGNWFNESEES